MQQNNNLQPRTPARSPLDQLFADAPQSTRDALAMHKAEKRRKDRKAFMDKTSETLKPEDITT